MGRYDDIHILVENELFDALAALPDAEDIAELVDAAQRRIRHRKGLARLDVLTLGHDDQPIYKHCQDGYMAVLTDTPQGPVLLMVSNLEYRNVLDTDRALFDQERERTIALLRHAGFDDAADHIERVVRHARAEQAALGGG